MNRDQLREYLRFYQDLGVRSVYRRGSLIPAPAPAATLAAEVRAAAISEHRPVSAQPVNRPMAPSPAAASLSSARPPMAKPMQSVSSPPAPPKIAAESRPLVKAATVLPAGMPSGGLPPLAPENDTLLQILEDIGDCRRCRLCEQRNKIVFGVGNEQARVVFVGEGPGADEDAQGFPFVGRAGQLLTQMIENTAAKEGIPIKRPDVYICNVVKCRPPENRTPLPDEMEICGSFLFRQLMVLKPTAICALGSTAAKALLATKEGVTRLRGNWHKWRDIPVMVTYHPSYLLRPYNQNAKREAWEDLKKVLHFVYD